MYPGVSRAVQRYGAALALVLTIALASVRYPAFATVENLFNVLRQNSMLGIVSLGMAFVVVHGGIDLSVGSLVAVGGITAAAASRLGSLAAVLAAVLAGSALGF